MDKRLKSLFFLLYNRGHQSADALAEHLDISSKTVRNLLKELDQILSRHGAGIESKYGAGYAIGVEDEEAFREFADWLSHISSDDFLPSSSEERIQYLLEYLFNCAAYVKLDDLSDSLYISKRTLTADLKEAEKMLNRYHLRLIRKPNYGIRVDGREFDFRLCIAFVTGKRLDKGNESMELIAGCIWKSIQAYDLTLSNVTFQNLIVHIYIAISRIMESHYVPIPKEQLVSLKGRREYLVAEDIIKGIEETFSITFPETEIAYVAIHLAGKMLFLQTEGIPSNLVITQEISDLVTEMLELVYAAFKFDFRRDQELRMSLSQHIIPLKVRLEYDMDLKNPLLKDVKERFCLSFTMASQAATVINRRYHTRLSDDEVGYIAFAFALALERRKTQIVKKNVLLVCASGRGSAQLLLYQYKKSFAPYLNRIETCDVCSLPKVDFSDIDYLITTVPIPIAVPVPILEVQYFLQDQDIANVKKALTRSSRSMVRNYFEEKLFIPHLSCRTKDEALSDMCGLMIREKHISETFYESVLERERLAQTAFFNMAAMPHSYKTMSEETHVCVAILDESIDWGGQQVQVIFLVSISNKDQTSVELQVFYQMTAAFLLGPKYIQDLIKNRNYERLVETLCEIEKTVEVD